MRLHSILIVLSLVALLSISAGGVTYFSSLHQSIIEDAARDTSLWAEHLRIRASTRIGNLVKTAAAMAGLRDMAAFLESPDPARQHAADVILDNFQAALGVSVCYLMDAEGFVPASSNRGEKTSFVGKYYGFRPYFTEALDGRPAIYMAVGVTSGERGVYYSHQVIGADSRPMGVVVIKDAIGELERDLLQLPRGDAVLIDPHGMVFAASKAEWVAHFFWPPTEDDLEDLQQTRQFGMGPWEWLGFRQSDTGQVTDGDGREYFFKSLEIESVPGWRVVFLLPREEAVGGLTRALYDTLGQIVIIILALVGAAVFILYRRAAADLRLRRSAERALRESEEKYRSILENMDEAYIEADIKGGVTFVNDAATRVFGYSRAELLAMDYRRLVRPSEAAEIRNLFQAVYRSGQRIRYDGIAVINKSGGKRWLEISAALRRDAAGNPLGFAGVARDVTERRKAEEAVRLGEQQYRSVLEASPDSVVVYDMQGRVTYSNPAFQRVFGWALEEVRGMRMDFFVPEENWHETGEMLAKTLAGETFADVETRRYNKSGEIIPVLISGSTYWDREGRLAGTVVSLRDTRSQKLLESQLRQAQKMEAVGTLASGISHDFNNLLQAISGVLELVISRQNLPPADLSHLRAAEQAVEQATGLVRQLLTFSRRVKLEMKPVDLAHEIQSVLTILERIIPRMIRIETQVAPELRPIWGDGTQVQQIMINLATNAKDAMPAGGQLLIEADNVSLCEETASRRLDLAAGDYVRLRVTDTGMGMDEETIAHIYEPFFTTKALGEGTGLGLATVYGIVKAHGAGIAHRSAMGMGTTFEIHFPALHDTPEAQAAPASGRAAAGRGELVMVVDDEDAIREIARDALTGAGYGFIPATSGEEALDQYREKWPEIDLVILDLGMPGMGGSKCLEGMLKINPGVRCIIASGYSRDPDSGNGPISRAAAYINKPYRLTRLLTLIRDILDRPPDDGPDARA